MATYSDKWMRRVNEARSDALMRTRVHARAYACVCTLACESISECVCVCVCVCVCDASTCICVERGAIESVSENYYCFGFH
jgi:hypothetical protein